MYKRILAAIDGSVASSRALDQAIDLARVTGATVRLVHVIDELSHVTGFELGSIYTNSILPVLRERSEAILKAGMARVAAAGISGDTLSAGRFGRRAADVILESALDWHADLLVLGTHGRRGLDRLVLGSDAEHVARRATMPVLLVRSGEVADGSDVAEVSAGASAPPQPTRPL